MKKRIRVFIYVLMIMALTFTGCTSGSPDTYSNSDIIKNKESGLEVHFLNIGQGDCTLIVNGDNAMMIDFGNNNKGTAVQKYLMDQGISHLDYAIGTHPDADHIGGMDVILYKFDVDHVLMPDVASDTATYRDVIETCKTKGYTIEQPVGGGIYALGDASFQILSPMGDTYADTNSYSIGIRLTYGNHSFIMCGDAPMESEEEMLASGYDLSADVLKLGHHGSSTSNGNDFLEAVNPTYGVLSCGLGNSYGHPHKETMDQIKSRAIRLFRTDLQGAIVAYSDGNTITWNVEPTIDYSSGETLSGSTADTVEKYQTSHVGGEEEDGNGYTETKGITYVINTNTVKFHLPSCSSVKDIKKENVEESTETKEELEARGHSPCKRCMGD